MEMQSQAMKRHGGEAPRYDTSRDGLERSLREKLWNSTVWNRPPGRRRSSDGPGSECIEKRLNVKVKTRVEPSGYGIDQRREATAEMGSEASGGAAERMGVQRPRGDWNRIRKATHEPKRKGRARRRSATHGKAAKWNRSDGRFDAATRQGNEMETTGIARTESIRS